MRVGLFVTCLVDALRPSIGFSALKLIEGAGYEVQIPAQQTCCGQPGYNSGDRSAAREMAEKLLREFESCDYVVVPSGSCGGMIRTHYPELFRDSPALLVRIERLGAKTYELTDFLARVARIRAVPGRFEGTVAYHDSCSGLRELGVKAQPRELLAMVPGLQIREMRDSEVCCGFGGLFSVKMGEISGRMADDKCARIAASGADAVVLGDLGCMLQIEGRLRKRGDARTRVLHVAEVLAGSGGGEE